jgi:septum formation protein
LVRRLELPFDIIPSEVAEYWMAESPVRLAIDNARRKNERSSVFGDRSRVLLSADTIVACESRIFGKPIGPESANRMLQFLSDRTHEVITGLCLSGPAFLSSALPLIVESAAQTRVRFRELPAVEIREYIASAEWHGKAGGYAIQGHGGRFVAELDGDFDNVVGLPLKLLDDLLRQNFIHCRFR